MTAPLSTCDGFPQPTDAAFLDELVALLAERADAVDRLAAWPGEQLRRAAEAGLVRWFVPPEFGGLARSQADVFRALSRLASACLTTAFCLTQPAGMAARVAASDNDELNDDACCRNYSTAGHTAPSASRN